MSGLYRPQLSLVAAGNHRPPGLLEINVPSGYVRQVSPGVIRLSVKALPCLRGLCVRGKPN